jgi:hypothetical protein
MLIRNWRYGVLVAVAVLSLAASNGCCCRTKKGIVLRGDWSLELNRVPHMQSNGPTYSCDCGVPCGTPCGCSDGCLQGGGGSGGYEVLDGPGYPDGPDGGGAHGAGGSGVGGRGAGGYGGDGGAPVPPMPTPSAQTRFHPIPTRPAFEPQSLAWDDHAADSVPGAAPQAPTGAGRRGGSRFTATRPNRQAAIASPIRRTSAEFEVDASDDFGEDTTNDDGRLSAAAPQTLPAAPEVEPAPTTSTWRVKSRQS